MDDNSEIPIDNGSLEPGASQKVELSPKKPNKRSTRFSVVRLEKRVSASFSILAKVFTIGAIVVVSVFIFRELGDDSYAINQINVPTAFEDAGLSGVVVANLISDRLTEIFEVLRAQEDALQYIKASDKVDVEVDMVGLGVPVRSFIALIGQSLGISRKRISGDIFITGQKAFLVLRVTGRLASQFEVELGAGNLKAACQELVEKASTHILKYTQPIALELYYSNVKHDGPNTVKMAQYLMDNFPNDPDMVRHAYDSWAWGLMYEGKLDEAEKKIIEAIAKYPTEERLYNAWGSVYAGQGKDEQAIEKYRMVLKLVDKDAPRRMKRMTTVYSNIGASFAYLGQYDSAMAYFNRALTIDKNDWILHYNVGGVYLLKNDTTQFLNQLEIALENGADVEMIRGDADLKSMMSDRRVIELLKRFSD